LNVSVIVEEFSSGALRLFVSDCSAQLIRRYPRVRLRVLGGGASSIVRRAEAKRLQPANGAGRGGAGRGAVPTPLDDSAVCVDDPSLARALVQPYSPSARCPAGLAAFDGITDLEPFLRASAVAIVLAESELNSLSAGTVAALAHGVHTVTTPHGWHGLGCTSTGPKASGGCKLLHVVGKMDCGSLVWEFAQAVQAHAAAIDGLRAHGPNATDAVLTLTKQRWLASAPFIALFMPLPPPGKERAWP
jgi:hypothetical protein